MLDEGFRLPYNGFREFYIPNRKYRDSETFLHW